MKSSLHQRAGFALVVCLSIIVLVLAVVLAFFAQATSNRVVEASRANSVEVEQAARSALDYVVASFLSEIATNSTLAVVAGETNYIPLSATNIVPARRIASGLTTTNFANLIRQSVPSVDPNASTHSSSEPSRNGRSISPSRWNSPQLLSGGGFSIAAELPNWIYAATGPAFATTPSTNTTTRFAFNVYDVGGLLDANVAGFPDFLSDADLQKIKGTLAGADLSRIGLSSSEVTALINWRNPSAVASSATYIAAVTNRAASGFLRSSSPNDREFTSRTELLRWVNESWSASSASNALPLLTHFTRELARPSLNTNGILQMSKRYDLSQLTSLTNTGLTGTHPNLTYTDTLAGTVSSGSPNFFQALRAAINFSGPSETNSPISPPYGTAPWAGNLDLKAIAIGANIIDQFTGTSEPTRILLGANRVAGKKRLPYVMQVFMVYNIEIGTPNILHVSVIPQVWCAGVAESSTTLTGSIDSVTVSVGSTTATLGSVSTTVSAPNTAGASPVFAVTGESNPAKSGFFGVSLPLTNAAPEPLNVTVNQMSFVARSTSLGTNAYQAFGASTEPDLPVSASLTTTFTLTNSISGGSTSPASSDVAGISLQSADPRTLRMAGTQATISGTNALSLAVLPASNPAYAGSLTDTTLLAPTNHLASVGELGAVFRESPWRSIDFASAPNSADSAVLDIFSAFPTHGTTLRAGTINLNTRQPAVLEAMLSRTATRIAPLSVLTAANATAFADQMVSSTISNPLDNRSKLIGLVSSNVIAQAGDLEKLSREAAIRALAEVGQTRTWNFLIDVIAQTGKMVGGTAPANFQMEAERRYWLHIAVDRYTGRIVDQQLETIND